MRLSALILVLLLPLSPLFPQESDLGGLEVLQEKPINLWPRFDWVNTTHETFLMSKLRQGDHVIYGNYLGTRLAFDSNQYEINKKKVLLAIYRIPSKEFLDSIVLRTQADIGGLWLYAEDPNFGLNFNRNDRRRLMEFVEKHGYSLTIGFDLQYARNPKNFEAASEATNNLILFVSRALTVDVYQVADQINKTVKRILDVNPDASIEVGIPIKIDNNTLEPLAELLNLLDTRIARYTLSYDQGSDHEFFIEQLLSQIRGSQD